MATKRIDYKLKPSRMHQGEARIRKWVVNPEEGTPFEALDEPMYWASIEYMLEVGDFIQVIPDERNYIAEFWVVEKGIGGIVVHLLWKTDIVLKGKGGVSMYDNYRVKFAGPHHKWRIERIMDNHVAKTGFSTENEANKWLGINAGALTKDIAAAKAA
jgi:hypothetical protein